MSVWTYIIEVVSVDKMKVIIYSYRSKENLSVRDLHSVSRLALYYGGNKLVQKAS
jgi:hypothetical protein